jgi:2-keto-4-pentenoate hydratase/2-oxohepta-3-ene-1,7-dioic acid hydratase in catechol pathway
MGGIVKLVTFKDRAGKAAPGAVIVEAGEIVSLGKHFPDMLSLIRAGEEGLAIASDAVQARQDVIALADVTLLAPIPVPESIRDCSVFEEHLLNAAKFMGRIGGEPPKIPDAWYQQPPYYKGNRFSVVGPETDIVWPPLCARLDYELEIAIVIGKQGRDIALEQAHDHIFGYMIYNDMSARDFQSLDMQNRLGPAKGKDFETGNIMGPWLVTRDEVPDPYALDMMAWVNGQPVGGGSTGGMYHKWDRIVSFISRDETLYPGEVIGSGTVGGGTLLEHGLTLNPGDLIEFEITGLGRLRNRVIKPDGPVPGR